MHPLRILSFLAALLVIPLARADIAVWKGQGTQTSNLSAVNGKVKVTIYFILDLETYVGRTVVATPSKLEVYDEGQRTYGINSLPSGTKQTFVFTDAIESSPQMSAVEYNHQISHVSGKAVSVFIGPQNTQETQLPKVIKYWLSETAGGLFLALGTVVDGPQLLFQTARTQAANAVNKTVMQVSQDIRAELISGKGYTEVTAPAP